MTGKDHNKVLSILMFVQGGLQIFGGVLVALMYGGIGTFMLTSARRDDEQMMGGMFIALAVIVGLVIFAFAGVTLLAGWKLLKEQSGGRMWGIIASIISLLSFPLGTALGVYGLWFLFGEEGKNFYAGVNSSNHFTPPPPNNWQ